MSITLRNVSKRFGSFTALDDVNLEVPAGSLLGLLGPSGSGKTTLLRILAGLEVPDRGTVCYGDEDATHRPARERNVGFVFQHYALFRHLTVFENVAFGLRVRHWPAARVRERVGELLRLVQLTGLEDRYPSQLSGGQRQRVALARALAPQPKVLLLDEPFGALDAKVRQELRQWLRRLHDAIGMTSVFVTHDQEEAFEVADQVVLMQAGRVEQVGTPMEVFEHPASPFVMTFLGQVNVFHGRLHDGRALLDGLEGPVSEYALTQPVWALANQDNVDGLEVPAAGDGPSWSQPLTAYVRPHELEVSRAANGVPGLRARVTHVNPAGAVARVRLLAHASGAVLSADLSPARYAELALRAGEEVFVSPRRVRLFEANQAPRTRYGEPAA